MTMAITADMVLEILTRYGTDAVFRTYASTSYAPGTGLVTLGSATDHVHKVVPPYSPRRGDLDRWGPIDGIRQAKALSAVSAAGLSFTPTVGMEFLYAGRTWRIVGVNPVRYQDAAVLYELALVAKVGG
jgi:hypothetical protein